MAERMISQDSVTRYGAASEPELDLDQRPSELSQLHPERLAPDTDDDDAVAQESVADVMQTVPGPARFIAMTLFALGAVGLAVLVIHLAA